MTQSANPNPSNPLLAKNILKLWNAYRYGTSICGSSRSGKSTAVAALIDNLLQTSSLPAQTFIDPHDYQALDIERKVSAAVRIILLRPSDPPRVLPMNPLLFPPDVEPDE